ncbi:serine-rich adhesin for platelets-like isoform X4 [Ruditapes philippinarum]|uniref:serine-rich adhesin for platelets-like isoform X4 n=1 Tax=Ruditapes philippinarum TaxID=129788 RepID=UPI00295B88FE|nr:serine-rich adhesin for platelets-like isoform X4 [Ruditapes philippinarum]
MSALEKNRLKCLNGALPESWEAKLVSDEGRIYYLDHKTQSSSWLPPRENWDPGSMGLPYGWEGAVDKNKKPYFINHVENFTSRDDPRDDPDYIEPPKPREVELVRDAQKGFGFVAGSEKPVVVRFVTEGGPSVDKLLPGDQIIKINGQDVKKAPREFVIDLVRSCKQSITLSVCQPYNDNNVGWLEMLRDIMADTDESSRKSALLTAAKKDRLKKNPSRVRFAEEIIVNGASVPSNSPEESYVPFMPNVLKVFLENGQTKSFKYDNKTTVKDVVNSLQEKLNIKCIQHFNLVLHNMKSHMPGRMTLLQDHETVSEIASRPGSRHFRCLFRVAYVPKDSYDLLKQDPIAFEYFYMQCVNDVLQDRFASELKTDILLRLAALHIQQHAMSNNMTGKINIKTVEKEFGFEKFVSQSIRENMKVKDLRKILAQCMKMNQNLTAPGQKQLTALQAKLHYMKIVSELKTFGSRVFMVTLLDKKTEAMVLVGPKSGVSLVTNVRFYTLSMLADFSEIQCIKVAKDKDNMHRVELSVKGDEPGYSTEDNNWTLNLGLLKEDAMNFVSMVNGYYKIFVDPNGSLVQKNAGGQSNDPDIPAYECKHTVFAAPWSYPDDIVSMTIDEEDNQGEEGENERVVDLSRGPPGYEGNKEFISKLKQDLGIKSEQKVNEATEVDGVKQITVPPSDQKPSVRVTSPVREPMKTVIKIESPRPAEAVQKPDKKDSESISSDTSSSMTSDTDSSPMETKHKPNFISQDRKRQRQSAGHEEEEANSRRFKIDSQKINGQYSGNSDTQYAEYMNTGKNRKLDIGGNNSDTDSGVGGEGDRNLSSLQDSIQDQRRSNGKEEEHDEWDTPPGTPTDALQSGRLELARHSELQLDLSSLIDPSYNSATAPESPSSSASLPDVDSSFAGPFDPDQLPLEIQNAMYDPRMFANNEIYIDPDIIDLTLLPPFPPTEEEVSSSQQQNGHPKLHRMATVSGDGSPGPSSLQSHQRSPVQKSVSVGHCPDFLDDDIDAIIDKLTLQPPPTSDAKDMQESADPDKLGTSWNGPMRGQENGGMEFENAGLSKTIDLGCLALDEQYSSLVIPPPPDESYAVQDIAIVPPIESVKEKRKLFEKSDSKGYLQAFAKQVSSDGKNLSVSKENKNNAFSQGNGNVETDATQNDNSPASVSEKLNALLKSLSSSNQEEEESLGHFRRTSSLRLGRSSSVDVLNSVQNEEVSKNSDLVVGSVRVKPRLRPKLSIERPAEKGHVSIPLKTSSLERVESVRVEENDTRSNFDSASSLKFQRTHSCDVLPTDKNDKSSSDSETAVSESFASLKAKLQSYRDSLLNRSLRRKKKLAGNKDDPDRISLDGDIGERKSSLTRSNSFSSLIRRSLGRAAGREFQKAAEGRSSSATRAGSTGGSDEKTDGKESHVMKDKKYWNTLTTPRSNFRPNTGSSQSQDDFFIDLSDEMRYTFPLKVKEIFERKPPLPSTLPPADKGETKKQKSGPIKALSSVFDSPKANESLSVPKSHKREKSPKRMAPQAPASAVQNTTATSTTSSVMSSATSVMSSATSSSVTSSKISARSKVETLASGLTKPLTIPTAPPRRKNGQGVRAQSPMLDQKSKDDSVINTESASKSDVKTSPFATVGKMWRPMSMTTSASNDHEETYQSYNNFDVLRDMTSERMQIPANTGTGTSKVNGHVSKGVPTSSNTLPVGKGKSSVVSKDGKTVSEKSFALLREKVSANHSNMVKQVLDTVYTSEDFVQATNDVDRLLNELKQTMESLKSSRIDKKPLQFNMCKDELQAQVRQFVTDAKLLVSNATQSKAKLAVNMDGSMHSLAKIFLHGQATMFMMEAIHQAQHLGSEVIRVANAYKSTLNAAHAAVGKPLSDPHMKYLMRQATNLASLLSTLLKSLKTLEQK